MASSAEQVSASLLQGALRAGVDTCVYLPDSVLTPFVHAFQGNQSVTMVSCAREDEGVAIAVGMELGGRVPICMMEASGLGFSGLILARAQVQRTPMVIVASHTAGAGEAYDYHGATILLSEGMFTPDENETCFWRERHALYGIGGPSARVHADVRGVEITPGKFLSDVLGYYFVLLVSDDEPAGVLSFVDQNSLGSAASHVGLGSVCILHAFRGRGCGTLLLSEALRLPKLRQMRATPLTATDRLAFYTTRRSATQPFLRPVVLDVVKANRTRWRELYSWYQRFGFESLENVSSTGFERLYMALKAEPTNYGYVDHSDHIHKPEASVL